MSLESVAVVLISKFPAPGKVKTRLTTQITPEQAAAVHRVFLLHLMRRIAALRPAELFVYFDPPDARSAMADLLSTHGTCTLVPQISGDLGIRLAHIAGIVGQSHPRMIILAVDSPDVPTIHIVRCAELTASVQVSIGPATDGGYWCLGLRSEVDAPRLLGSGIEWSTERTGAQTMRNAQALGHPSATGDLWDDVDQPEDLTRLLARLSRSSAREDQQLFGELKQILADVI